MSRRAQRTLLGVSVALALALPARAFAAEGANIVYREGGSGGFVGSQISNWSGGAFFPAGTRLLDMAAALDASLENLERAEQESTTIRRSTPRFQWFAGLALILLALESLLSERRGGLLGALWSRSGRGRPDSVVSADRPMDPAAPAGDADPRRRVA